MQKIIVIEQHLLFYINFFFVPKHRVRPIIEMLWVLTCPWPDLWWPLWLSRHRQSCSVYCAHPAPLQTLQGTNLQTKYFKLTKHEVNKYIFLFCQLSFNLCIPFHFLKGEKRLVFVLLDLSVYLPLNPFSSPIQQCSSFWEIIWKKR